ncbi:hypothetical protein SDC9_103164 [bioreactor metagenome]|uniref:Uncharacterized protein n=1 Tax=bioreactor metagenome TaxID=1076179 RepID=A0A645ASW7_9ZZZZ
MESLIELIGIAKPNPSTSSPDDLALTIPISSPYALNKAPPELPGLTAAFVCRRFIVVESIVISRSKALRIPLVTVPPNSPSGLPIATTVSPTDIVSESPSTAGCKSVASIFKIEISFSVSLPIIVASYSVPSFSRTVTLVAPSMT